MNSSHRAHGSPVSGRPSPRQVSLRLSRLRVPVRLGCTADERANAQPVEFGIELRFERIPAGCTSDRLEDTFCYATLARAIAGVCERREFTLVESLGYEVYERLRGELPSSVLLKVEANKVNAPVPGLQGGAIFCLSDWES